MAKVHDFFNADQVNWAWRVTEKLFIDTIKGLEYRDAIALDIGANIGVYTEKLALKFSKVYAFEPHPSNFEHLKTLASAHVEPIQKAIGWYDGKVKLTCSGQPGEHTINPDVEDRQYREKSNFLEVDCVTLDTFCANKPNIVFIKCDVESGEDYIFRPECAGKILSSGNITLALETHIEVDLHRLYNDLFSYGYRNFFNEEGKVSGLSKDQQYIIKK